MPLPTRQPFAVPLAAALLAVFASSPAPGQPAHLLADLSALPADRQDFQRLPPSSVVLDGIAYFTHQDGVTGQELWRSDGTADGTWRVRDICPGRCWGWVEEITRVGDRLFFLADDGAHGRELWTSDGTSEGTRLVVDLVPGIRGSGPTWITAFGEGAFFSANDGIHGEEPWFTDGTAAGTVRLGDLAPEEASSEPSGTVALEDRLLFFAYDGVHGYEPWITDGTPAGTELLLDLHPGGRSSSPPMTKDPLSSRVVRLGDRAVFSAADGVHGEEPWVSDGTPGGTALLADLAPGSNGSRPRAPVLAGGRLYFEASGGSMGGELFATDGETVELIVEPLPGDAPSIARPMGAVGDVLLFASNAGGLGTELWKTDGTEEGTVLVRDLIPGAEGGLDDIFALAWPATAAGGRLFFAAHTAVGIEPWVSDGTEAGTHLVKDIWPGPQGSIFAFFNFAPGIALEDRLLFFPSHPELVWEPWISDGTEAGTTVVRDVFQAASSVPSFLFVETSLPIDAGGRMYFAALGATTQRHAWTSRGTSGSTRQVELALPAAGDLGYNGPAATLGRRLFGTTSHTAGQELWVTNADGDSGSHVADVEGAGGSFASLGGRSFFPVRDENGSRLWASDGTLPGTGPVADVDLGPANLVTFDDRLYFSATSDEGHELWSTDGEPGGSVPVADLEPGPEDSDPQHLTVSGDRLFFAARTVARGSELWITDGEQTAPLPEVRPGAAPGVVDHPGPPRGRSVVAVAGGVLFLGDDGVTGEEPWWSDGVAVAPVGDLRPGQAGSHPRFPTAVGGEVLFAADDGSHGRELWRWRPGEAAAMIADLVPGPGSSLPQELAAADGLLYFSAFTPDRGVELWKSDGTAAGTVPVQDVWPGEESSTPSSLTVSGRYLYFTADDGEHGREMWSLLLPTRRPRAFLSAAGALTTGGRLVLTLRLENPPPEELPDGDGDELTLPLPAELRVVELAATSGTAAVEPGGGAALATGPRASSAAAIGEVVTWNGSLPPGGFVELTITVAAGSPPAAGVSLQASGAFDSDGDGSNETNFDSDDPSLPGEGDVTFLAFAVAIPSLAPLGGALLALSLALAAARQLRRRVT